MTYAEAPYRRYTAQELRDFRLLAVLEDRRGRQWRAICADQKHRSAWISPGDMHGKPCILRSNANLSRSLLRRIA